MLEKFPSFVRVFSAGLKFVCLGLFLLYEYMEKIALKPHCWKIIEPECPQLKSNVGKIQSPQKWAYFIAWQKVVFSPRHQSWERKSGFLQLSHFYDVVKRMNFGKDGVIMRNFCGNQSVIKHSQPCIPRFIQAILVTFLPEIRKKIRLTNL